MTRFEIVISRVGRDFRTLCHFKIERKGVWTMATTTQPVSGETTEHLINYRTDAGVAVIEMNDPPANTYTYEMNRQLDDAILKARMENDAHVIVLTGAGDKFFSAGANIKMMVTGNTFSFEEAKELGIINDIFDRDGFMENIMEYARQFCPPNKAAKAVGRIKRAVQTGWEIPMESALAVERENQQLLFQSEDAKEGLAAYVEKRPATFKAK